MQKLQLIPSFTQLNALLAAMLSFAARVRTVDSNAIPDTRRNGSTNRSSKSHHHSSSIASNTPPLSYEHFSNLAAKFIQEAIDECGDGVPSLCLLQALVISTHGQLVNGVRGKAWRSLGTCVRMAYEMNLHLVDSSFEDENAASSGAAASTTKDIASWSQDEERRRAWWAIWEMDVFASTIRRCPTAIDWTQNETFLPVGDAAWFAGTREPSCLLHTCVNKRWKALQSCGSRSAKAWFIVVNSLMREAQLISSPRSVYKASSPLKRGGEGSGLAGNSPSDYGGTRSVRDVSDQLATLSNALRCFILALPDELKYKSQYLSFDPHPAGQNESLRHKHSAIYSIHVMTQLAWLMILHYHVFVSPDNSVLSEERIRQSGNMNSLTDKSAAGQAIIDQYFDAADRVLAVVQGSCEEHVRYINPFLASTIWLAAAAQLVRKEFGRGNTNKALTISKFDVLWMTYKQSVDVWNISTALQQNLDCLATELRKFRSSNAKEKSNSSLGNSHNLERLENGNNTPTIITIEQPASQITIPSSVTTSLVRESTLVTMPRYNLRISLQVLMGSVGESDNTTLQSKTFSNNPQMAHYQHGLSTAIYESNQLQTTNHQRYPHTSFVSSSMSDLLPIGVQPHSNVYNMSNTSTIPPLSPSITDASMDGSHFGSQLLGDNYELSQYLNMLLSGSYGSFPGG